MVFSRAWDEHVNDVRKLFDTLKKKNLYLKLPKHEFRKTSLVYLGNVRGGG